MPTVVLDDGRPIAESGAILWYFGEGTRFVPDDASKYSEDELFAFFEDVLDDLPFIETADAVELASGAVALVGVLTKACRQAKPRPWRARRRGVA